MPGTKRSAAGSAHKKGGAKKKRPARKAGAKKKSATKKPAKKSTASKKTGLEAKTVDQLRKMAAKKKISVTVGHGDSARKLRKAELIRRLK